MTPHENFSDADLQAAFDELSEVPTPSSTHLQQVHVELLSRTSGSVAVNAFNTDELPIVKPIRRFGIWISATVVALVGFAVFLVVRPDREDGAISSFRQVLFETQSHPWVHGQTRVEFAGKIHEFETWFSPSERLAAMRSPELLQYTDFDSGRQSTYDRATKQLTQGLANPHSEDFGRALIMAILQDGDLQGAMPFLSVSDLQKVEIEENDVRLLKYKFQVVWRSNAAVGWETTVGVDRERQLIRTWEERHSNGTTVVTHFDYPPDGPRDLESLGVPVEIVR
jgi:hypothetical protein